MPYQNTCFDCNRMNIFLDKCHLRGTVKRDMLACEDFIKIRTELTRAEMQYKMHTKKSDEN